jgi:hypothetical protein
VSTTASTDDLREPEVGDEGTTAGVEQHVVGLEVAVHDAGVVCCGEPFAGVDERRDHGRPRLVLADPRPQRLALHELHHEEQLLAVAADIVDRGDVR